MAVGLRILLLVAAVVTAFWILLKIRKLKVKMEDAIFWVCFAAVLLIMGIFPGVTYWLTGVLHMLSPANLIFLIIIALLMEKVFTLSIITSQLEEKVTVLSAEVALRSHADSRRIGEEQEQIEELDAEKNGRRTANRTKEGQTAEQKTAAAVSARPAEKFADKSVRPVSAKKHTARK